MRHDEITSAVSFFTGLVALSDIENIISIIVLVLSIANILFNLVMRIVDRIKNKDYKGISDDIVETTDALEHLKNHTEGSEE